VENKVENKKEDIFREPREEVDLEENIKKSRFIGRVRLARSEEEAREKLRKLSEQYRNATHNCWAYRVGFPQMREYYSDDGEPSGSAGKPILGAILREDLTNTLVVVTRYYGGIKLGVRGLIEAYGGSASAALKKAGAGLKQMARPLSLEVRYDAHQRLLHYLKDLQVPEHMIEQQFGATIIMHLPVPLSLEEEAEILLQGLQGQGTLLSWKWEV
jgi:uncharacterized YigZ family protein